MCTFSKEKFSKKGEIINIRETTTIFDASKHRSLKLVEGHLSDTFEEFSSMG